MDAETIYNTLENEIVPLYYRRDKSGVPTGWVASMKKCLAEISPRFTMKRMMDDYFNQYYNKMIERTNWMRADRYQKAFEINSWKSRVSNTWDKVEVKFTPGLEAGDLAIELVFGDKNNDMVDEIVLIEKMKLVDSGDDWAKYYIKVPIKRAGIYNYTFRVYPTNAMLPHRMDFPLVKWI